MRSTPSPRSNERHALRTHSSRANPSTLHLQDSHRLNAASTSAPVFPNSTHIEPLLPAIDLALSSISNDVPTKRRGTAKRLPRHQRRHCPMTDCPIIQPPIHAFDELAWISMLDATPEQSGTADIADLSMLEHDEAQGPGPIRRRRTSLRSETPRCLAQSDPFPSTPIARQRRCSPSAVRFHHLMPLFAFDSPPFTRH